MQDTWGLRESSIGEAFAKRRMEFSVLDSIHHGEVFGAVVIPDPVEMMHVFIIRQRSAQGGLHDVAMFKHLAFAGHADDDVAIAIGEACTFPSAPRMANLESVSAISCAKLSSAWPSQFVRLIGKRSAALLAKEGYTGLPVWARNTAVSDVLAGERTEAPTWRHDGRVAPERRPALGTVAGDLARLGGIGSS